MSGETVVFLVALPFMAVAWLKGRRLLAGVAAGALVVVVAGVLSLYGLLLLFLAVPVAFGPAFGPARPGSFWWERVYSDARRDRVANRAPFTSTQRWVVAIGAFLTLLTGFGLVLGSIVAGLGHQDDVAERFGIAVLLWAGTASVALGLYRSRPWSFLAVPVLPLLFVVVAGAAVGEAPRETVSEHASGPVHFLAFSWRSFEEIDLLALDSQGRTLAVVSPPFVTEFGVCPEGRRIVSLKIDGFVVHDLATLTEVASYPAYESEPDGSVQSFKCLSPEGDAIVAIRGRSVYPTDDEGHELPGGPIELNGQIFVAGTNPATIVEGEWDSQEPGGLSPTHAIVVAGARFEPSPDFPRRILIIALESGRVTEVPEWLIFDEFVLDPTGRWAYASGQTGSALLDLSDTTAEPLGLPNKKYETSEIGWMGGRLILVSPGEALDVVDPETMALTTIEWSGRVGGIRNGLIFGIGDDEGATDGSVLYRVDLKGGQPVAIRMFDTGSIQDLIVLPEPIEIDWPVTADE